MSKKDSIETKLETSELEKNCAWFIRKSLLEHSVKFLAGTRKKNSFEFSENNKNIDNFVSTVLERYWTDLHFFFMFLEDLDLNFRK